LGRIPTLILPLQRVSMAPKKRVTKKNPLLNPSPSRRRGGFREDPLNFLPLPMGGGGLRRGWGYSFQTFGHLNIWICFGFRILNFGFYSFLGEGNITTRATFYTSGSRESKSKGENLKRFLDRVYNFIKKD